MIPATFSYKQAASADEAVSLAAEYGEDAKYLAGGHSLLPLMKLRLAAPEVLIDIGALRDLSYVQDGGDHVTIGALTRHHDVAGSDLLAAEIPLLAHAAAQVGDPQIRHRGTIGGSVAHADPASDLPAVLLALDAVFMVRGADGVREIPAGEFFQSLFETALEPGELLTEIRVPKPPAPGWSFQKFTQRAIDWAIVGVAVQGGNVALVNMASTPLRAAGVEQALAAGAGPADAAAHAAEGTSAPADIRASTAYREHLARVLTRRALEEARLSKRPGVSLPGYPPDQLLERVRACLPHVHDMPQVEEGGEPGCTGPAAEDDRDDRATPAGDLREQGLDLKRLPGSGSLGTHEHGGRLDRLDALAEFLLPPLARRNLPDVQPGQDSAFLQALGDRDDLLPVP